MSRVLIFVGAFEPGFKAGGPIKSMVELLDGLPPSVQVTLVTGDRDLGDSVAYPGLSGCSVLRGHHLIHYLNWRDPRQWVQLLRNLRRTRFDLLYVNSLWSPQFTVLPVVLRLFGQLTSRELLLAPRGELSPGALSVKGDKKRRFLRVWRPLLRKVDPMWHASTTKEQCDITDAFPGARTVVVGDSRGNEPIKTPTAAGATARFVFLSRICEMKNLALVLEAAQLLTSEVDLDVFGPIEDNFYWDACLRLIDQMPSNLRVAYRGMVRPEVVQTTFTEYDAFVLPTLGENFGHVIGESLSAGCPVVCSQNSPWTAVLQDGGGAALARLDARTWAVELGRLAALSPAERTAGKQAALDAYRRWREVQPPTTVVELVLDLGVSDVA
ncbi:glycosyltransferase [Aeromicrobium sp.]|uniref:glycosyltransferase n=1 Tax=Aeromicrobium sp. TaxID=1871063 RepID=UPI0019AF07F2|nr:glycosyltransferase [Aeromicrobium sp.]MBC7632934.1 glycosyltransferase [Aeromicrobium sp.]